MWNKIIQRPDLWPCFCLSDCEVPKRESVEIGLTSHGINCNSLWIVVTSWYTLTSLLRLPSAPGHTVHRFCSNTRVLCWEERIAAGLLPWYECGSYGMCLVSYHKVTILLQWLELIHMHGPGKVWENLYLKRSKFRDGPKVSKFMCTVKLSFTCLNISSEVNIPKAVVCWLHVNAKARGEEKGCICPKTPLLPLSLVKCLRSPSQEDFCCCLAPKSFPGDFPKLISLY